MDQHDRRLFGSHGAGAESEGGRGESSEEELHCRGSLCQSITIDAVGTSLDFAGIGAHAAASGLHDRSSGKHCGGREFEVPSETGRPFSKAAPGMTTSCYAGRSTYQPL
jgi:hypothetical protein